jgi:hypothetical protein
MKDFRVKGRERGFYGIDERQPLDFGSRLP